MRIGRQQPGQELAEQQGRREDDEQLVAQRPQRDPLDDRQLAVGREALDVARGDGGVVDDHAGRLGARAAGGGGHVVHRRSRQLRHGHDVVEQGDQSAGHGCAPRSRGQGVARAPHPPTRPTVTRAGPRDLRSRPPGPTVGAVQRHEISHLAHRHHPVMAPLSDASVDRLLRAARPAPGRAGARPGLRQRRLASLPADQAPRPDRGRRRPPPAGGPGGRSPRRPVGAATLVDGRRDDVGGRRLRRRHRGRCRPRLRRSGHHPGCRAPSPRAGWPGPSRRRHLGHAADRLRAPRARRHGGGVPGPRGTRRVSSGSTATSRSTGT